MKLIFRKPIEDRIMDAVSEAEKENKKIYKIILSPKEFIELRSFSKCLSGLNFHHVWRTHSSMMFFGVRIALDKHRRGEYFKMLQDVV